MARRRKETQGIGKLGCVFMVLMFTLFPAVIIFVATKLGPQAPESVPVPGDAARFDPVTAFEEVQKFAGEGALLVSMEAYYVRSDGTLDLTTEAYYPNVSYEFVRRMSEPPTNAPPVGAGGSVTGEWYEPIEVEVSRPGQWYTRRTGGGEVSYMHQGMERDVGSAINRADDEAIPEPQCSMAKLWEIAMTQDASRDAVAIIRYDADGYEFSISDLGIFLRFTPECQLID